MLPTSLPNTASLGAAKPRSSLPAAPGSTWHCQGHLVCGRGCHCGQWMVWAQSHRQSRVRALPNARLWAPGGKGPHSAAGSTRGRQVVQGLRAVPSALVSAQHCGQSSVHWSVPSTAHRAWHTDAQHCGQCPAHQSMSSTVGSAWCTGWYPALWAEPSTPVNAQQ